MAAAGKPRILLQLDGCGLTTAEIHYGLPDHLSLLQPYVWRDYDQIPDFPELRAVLHVWQQELEGALHSVRADRQRLVNRTELRIVDGVMALN